MTAKGGFDPNVSHSEPDNWGSYCPQSYARCRGSDGWSTHETRANARRGISQNLGRYGMEDDIILYERVDTRWVERERWHWDDTPCSDDPADGNWRVWRHTVLEPDPSEAPSVSLREAILTALRAIEYVNHTDGYFITCAEQAGDGENGDGYYARAIKVLCAYTGFEGDV